MSGTGAALAAPIPGAVIPGAVIPGAVPTRLVLPLVSVIIPARSESRFIAACLDSVLANDYPHERLEILVVDGRSSDGTREIVARYARRFHSLRLVDNPQKTTPAALNHGIRAARGAIIIRVDAHARLSRDYISQCVSWLEASGADNVGGVMRTLPREPTWLGAVIAVALSHPFGVGNSAFRLSQGKPRWADTVFGGCYRRETIERLGGFNEKLSRGQDLEFNRRLQRAGGRTLLVPSIRCEYFARTGPWSFLRHTWINGVWAIRPFLDSEVVPVRPRHLAPLAFMLALTLSALAATASNAVWPLQALASLYLASALAASAHAAWRARSVCCLLALPAVFGSLHATYGLGSAWGLATSLGIAAGRRIRCGRRGESREGAA